MWEAITSLLNQNISYPLLPNYHKSQLSCPISQLCCQRNKSDWAYKLPWLAPYQVSVGLAKIILAASHIRAMKVGGSEKSRWCIYSMELLIMTLFMRNLCWLFLITLRVSVLPFLHQVRPMTEQTLMTSSEKQWEHVKVIEVKLQKGSCDAVFQEKKCRGNKKQL